ETTAFEAIVQPRGRGEQRRWLDVAVDLSPWAGRRVRLTLRTDPRQDTSYDWSGWAEPAVVRVDPLTPDRPLRSTAETVRGALHRCAAARRVRRPGCAAGVARRPAG